MSDYSVRKLISVIFFVLAVCTYIWGRDDMWMSVPFAWISGATAPSASKVTLEK